jgi:uncharacterized membrane protein YoaK (UPF0700 family)
VTEGSDLASSSTLKRPTVTGGLLAVIAGYVDTLGFIALFGLFTSHITGNFVLLGSEIVHPTGGVLLKLLAFPAFLLAVAFARVFSIVLERHHIRLLRPLLALQAVFLLAFWLAGEHAQPIVDAEATAVLAAGMLGTIAMGVQNATSRIVVGSLAPSTAMTSNVTQLMIDAVDLLLGSRHEALRNRFGKLFWPVLGFALGAPLGAFGYLQFGFASLALPLLALVALAILEPG